MDLQTLLREEPRFHRSSTGYISWRLDNETFDYIASCVGEQSKTLETGAGVSTVAFILLGANHTCITPEQIEIDRITEYCKARDISLSKTRFIVKKSEEALPMLNEEGLDLILIDGAHKFPVPFLDWYYTAPMLKIGGRLLIDDVNLWTGNVLKRFLLREDEWMLDRELQRWAAFVKIREGSYSKAWTQQPFFVAESRRIQRRANLRFALKHLVHAELYKSARLLWRMLHNR